MAFDEARLRAERAFKQEERERDGKAAMVEYEAGLVALREKTARLKALRLAREAEAERERNHAENPRKASGK